MQQGTFGFRISIPTGCDLTGADALSVRLSAPSGTIREKGTDKLRVDGVLNGLLSFEVEEGDLAEVGCYWFQVVDRSQSRFLASEICPFEVMANL
jgi:hypothetical protein